MKPIQQYVNQITGNRYYYSFKPVICNNCEKHISDFVAIHINWGKKKSEVLELCFDCSKKYLPTGQVEEKFIMNVINRKPLSIKGNKLVLITPPELRNHTKDDSVFSNTIDSPRIINNCKFAGHRDYTVLDDNAPAQIGARINEDFEAEKDKLIDDVDELDSLLAGFKSDKLLIGNDEDDEEDKKLLE